MLDTRVPATRNLRKHEDYFHECNHEPHVEVVVAGGCKSNFPGNLTSAKWCGSTSAEYGFKRLEAILPSLITQYRELQIKSDPRVRVI